MKRFISVILRLIVILLSVSFNIIRAVIHINVTARTYSMMPEFIVTTILIIVTAVLFALSVTKFKLTGKAEKIAMCILLAVALIAVVMLFGYYGILYVTIFVCTAYTMDLILSK